MDVFVYVVVLNLAVEYVPSVITEGFTVSLLTAVVLKQVLEAVVWAKGLVVRGLRGADTRQVRLALGVALWVVRVRPGHVPDRHPPPRPRHGAPGAG